LSTIARAAPDRLAVATACPSCGAPLDFSEGSNAIRCAYCGVNLLVTGRRRVLSYFIPPKLDAGDAVATARRVHATNGWDTRSTQPRIYFVPYYRMTGSEFRWEKVRPPCEERHSLADCVRQVRSPVARIALVASGLTNPVEERIEFGHRLIEKNFVACEVPELGVYSLGVRPGILRLELFRRQRLEAWGGVVRIDLSADRAMERGLKSPSDGVVVHREVVERMLSLIYFPFWVVGMARNGSRQLAIVDAVSSEVVESAASVKLLERLDRGVATDGEVLGFRPLVCPNCGWDLPVRPDDVIFVCGGCTRAWQIVGERLDPVPVEVVEAASGTSSGSVKYLPIWVLGSAVGGRRRYFVPAFRCRRLELINDLATRLTRESPSYCVIRGETLELGGCALDREDAVAVARFISADPRREENARRRGVVPPPGKVAEARLTWFPFTVDAYALRDSFTGTALPTHSVG
jgi:LSD1 subclass zinc finger protein